MAADFWTSSQSKMLLDPDDLARAELHDDEAARGLTLTDIRLIKIHYCDHIRALALPLKVRQRVVATAILYLRRVFVRRSMLEFEPGLLALACIYLASKAEECPVQAKSVIKCMQIKEVQCGGHVPGAFSCGFGSSVWLMKDLLEMEMRLLHTLDYNLITFHPYRPLTIMAADAAKSLGLADGVKEKLTADAWAMINDAFKSDLCLLHPPHIIAAACLHLAAITAGIDVSAWMQQLQINAPMVQHVSLVLLDHYQALTSLKPGRMEAAVKKLPPVPPKQGQAQAHEQSPAGHLSSPKVPG